jgi:hypothetical protein
MPYEVQGKKAREGVSEAAYVPPDPGVSGNGAAAPEHHGDAASCPPMCAWCQQAGGELRDYEARSGLGGGAPLGFREERR